MCTLVLTWLVILTLSGVGYSQTKGKTFFSQPFEVRITGAGRDERLARESDPPCNKFKLSEQEAKQFFTKAKKIDNNELHYGYLWMPCYVTGTLRTEGKVYRWKIREGATAEIETSGADRLVLGCKKCGNRFQYETHK